MMNASVGLSRRQRVAFGLAYLTAAAVLVFAIERGLNYVEGQARHRPALNPKDYVNSRVLVSPEKGYGMNPRDVNKDGDVDIITTEDGSCFHVEGYEPACPGNTLPNGRYVMSPQSRDAATRLLTETGRLRFELDTTRLRAEQKEQ